MSITSVTPGLNFGFEHGLESLDYSHAPGLVLPRSASLPPAEVPAVPRLDALLHPPGIGDYLREGLAPQLSDPMLLLPGRFHDALQQARKLVTSPTGTASPRLAAKAMETLDREIALQELCSYLRQALQAG